MSVRPCFAVPLSVRHDMITLGLEHGTREPDDIGWYLGSNKVYFRGVGLIARLEALDYLDGESA